SAVEAALRWLARHQEADGHWDAVKYESTGYQPHMGCTGLALLAFLGAGYTHKSGQFSDNVNRAIKWILANQKKDGAIFFQEWGRPAGSYGHAIAGLALAEAYGMSRDESLREPAQRAVQYSLATMQQPYSGWRYFPKGQDDDLLADTSVTGWYVMQLKSAKIAGLSVDGSGFQGASKFIDSVTDKGGRAGYSGPSAGTPAMTSVAMVARQFMGTPASDPLLVGGSNQLLTMLPKWQDATEHNDFYYVYYGTLSMFQMGGDKWTKWNEAIKPLLVNNQCRGPLPLSGAATDKDGSWDSYGHSGKLGGRVFMTAVGALTLEVYYRYLPMYAGNK
ncbi:MAG TPA: terpene cyclase/mutase family protein, partial [Planctomycetota bacterium]|nr:terpene cyclase/mutase family protein [Planctomycetota bacterium]